MKYRLKRLLEKQRRRYFYTKFLNDHSFSRPKTKNSKQQPKIQKNKKNTRNTAQLWYDDGMAKRATGVDKMKTVRSRKTKKRLEIKKVMLAEKAAKRNKK
jgi:hypothetical protein